uniref:NADH dehydrogenase subunit 4 n=1 Tax=Eoneureclipsis hainanensis TaxID=3043990 RepID=UPI002551D8D1|nr:NADH dehydrogenase subunit 4 [Eoneureclipsis hainanensis]WGT74390.1 NADH dehydrogenase subunit 4 [Eoneureclipsis hainanensis]
MLSLIFFLFTLFLFVLMGKNWILMNSMALILVNLLMMNFSSFNFSFMSLYFSIDLLSWGLIILSVWIIFLMIMISGMIYKKYFYKKMFLFNNILLLMMLILVFSSMNIFMFYLFFEVSLIPVLMLIIGWGYQVERIQAGIYLLFYTLFLSLPMLMGLINIYFNKNYLMIYMISGLESFILYFILVMSFLVKMPMYAVHLWLLKAHVEAPVSGSMILAGLMLKLGGYGMIRVMNFFLFISLKFNFYFIIFSLVGGVYLAMMCFMQVDLKLLIAMSSVVHMSMVIAGIMTLTFYGMSGSYLLMVGHGLCSSGLFVLINLSYERVSSRSMMLNKGALSFAPLLSLWWFLLMSSNMAAPPSLNLLGEISLMVSIVSYSFYLMILLILLSFFGSIYNLYLYSFSQHGLVWSGLMGFNSVNSREYLVLLMHWLPLNLFILNVDFLYLMI